MLGAILARLLDLLAGQAEGPGMSDEFSMKTTRKLSARTLVGYLHSGALEQGQVTDRIGDIDLIDPYAFDLYSYFSGLP